MSKNLKDDDLNKVSGGTEASLQSKTKPGSTSGGTSAGSDPTGIGGPGSEPSLGGQSDDSGPQTP